MAPHTQRTPNTGRKAPPANKNQAQSIAHPGQQVQAAVWRGHSHLLHHTLSTTACRTDFNTRRSSTPVSAGAGSRRARHTQPHSQHTPNTTHHAHNLPRTCVSCTTTQFQPLSTTACGTYFSTRHKRAPESAGAGSRRARHHTTSAHQTPPPTSAHLSQQVQAAVGRGRHTPSTHQI
jgi:hypothetical protein